MKLRGNITISRSSRDVITVVLEDENSGIRFASAEIAPADFSMALTGLGHVHVSLEVDGLEYVGRVRETQAREIVCPMKSYDREEMSKWLVANAQEPGWILDAYLGSQRSLENLEDGNPKLHYRVIRYVEPAPTGANTAKRGMEEG